MLKYIGKRAVSGALSLLMLLSCLGCGTRTKPSGSAPEKPAEEETVLTIDEQIDEML